MTEEKKQNEKTYTLTIGKIDKKAEVNLTRKMALTVRDALREAGIEAGVLLISKPKILD